ncbi:hypothetical protein [Paraburkholderia fungorum]|jgi:hypothetical protein|uniref:hypothetical protein n=1 Tax=Paraburkholderia fungorum TaxID=134537 RepID=UPI003877C671
MTSVTVTTSEELKEAQQAKIDEIFVTGELAGKLKSARKVTALGAVALAAIGAIAVTAIPSGGASTLGLVPVAALTGVEIATIIFVVTIGLATIIALFRDYDAEFTMNGAKFKKKR